MIRDQAHESSTIPVSAYSSARNDRPARIDSHWIIGEGGDVEVTSLKTMLKREKKSVIVRISNCTILLPPAAGGLHDGMLDGDSSQADDIADITEPRPSDACGNCVTGRTSWKMRVSSTGCAWFEASTSIPMTK